jgi:hypothetical protein
MKPYAMREMSRTSVTGVAMQEPPSVCSWLAAKGLEDKIRLTGA